MNLARYYSSFAVFLLGSVALVVPSGYSIGFALLLLASFTLLWRKPAFHLQAEDKLIMAVIASYSLILITQLLMDGASIRELDRPSRFLFSLPVILYVIAYPPKLASLFAGLILGSILTGGWAAWQKLFLNVERAGGYTNTIQFGNISILLGFFCLAGLGWASIQPRAKAWMALLVLGALLGVLGSLLSGSRGGWIGLPFLFFILYRAYGRDLTFKIKFVILSMVFIFISAIYLLPQTGVKERVSQAVENIRDYTVGDNKHTSVGLRLDMWKGALNLISEKPISGWGWGGYKERMQELVDEKDFPQFAADHHTHNEYLDNYGKRGLLGLVSLLALYLVPFSLFARHLTNSNIEIRSLATMGALLPVAFMDFGLTQTFFSHNSGVMVYSCWLAVIWGSMRALENNRK
ncbi:O-antigen ligase family protein [Marinospirillum insulare]|uniref:Rhodanese domain-containing protein n=1 Tax=Marinospirillum insulare TaxID=217169 RepID=A0ABQ5ZZB1_9GAMM|nr:O-antigen ligase family protein [Marinospirillum insulare]GLR64365.1 hypothetical protein GCM10007878_18030 [Marinospirillum insulare]